MIDAPRISPVVRIGHHLHEALGLIQAHRFTVFGEIVAADDVRNALALQPLLGRADDRDLRIAENRVRA